MIAYGPKSIKIRSIEPKMFLLTHYGAKKPSLVRTDTDETKLHGISVTVKLCHGDIWKPVDCASRFLTPTEKNDCPIELEVVAAIWGCKRMSKY